MPEPTTTFTGCRHSSVDSSVPTILLPWVRVPNTPTTLLSFIVFVPYLSCVKNENKQKEAGIGPYLKKPIFTDLAILQYFEMSRRHLNLDFSFYAIWRNSIKFFFSKPSFIFLQKVLLLVDHRKFEEFFSLNESRHHQNAQKYLTTFSKNVLANFLLKLVSFSSMFRVQILFN